jgi:sugar phosphate isomerase/epimerase
MRDLNGHLELCSINTATVGHQWPLDRLLDAVARAGYGGVAPWRREVEAAGVGATARQLRALGLRVTGYCRSTYLTAPTRQAFLAGVADNRVAIEQAAELGAACFVVVHGGLVEGSKDIAGARAQGAEAVALLWEHAKTCGVALAIEPLHPMYAAERSLVVTLEQGLDLCAAIDPDNGGGLGVAVDVYHCWWDPRLAEMVRRGGAARRILAFHVSDWLVPTRDTVFDRGMMGDGVIEIATIRGMLEDAGYAGAVEAEIFSRDDWWRRDVDETLAVCAARLQAVC